MKKLKNYIEGKWVEGGGDGRMLFNAINGQEIALASTKGIDFEGMLTYGRTKGRSLAKMNFLERGLMLKKLALHLTSIKEKFYPISYQSGATRADSWIDIEGGFGNLFANASLRKKLGNESFLVEGDHIGLSKGGTFIGHHIMVPKGGVAIHINAFNFPVWGMLEKCAVNWMAGMPAIVKPATITSYLTHAVAKEIIESGILPEGSLQLLCGSAGSLLDFVESADVVTFTGSATTGQMLKAHPRIISESVPFNMEADSLNSAILGKDVTPDSEEFGIFIKEVRREMTVKCGQKCTAIRRIIVPDNLLEDVQIALGQALGKVVIGNPENEKVRMGSLAGFEQVEEVRARIEDLKGDAEIVFGNPDGVIETIDADSSKGAFFSPVLLRVDNPHTAEKVHSVEAFGPVSTIMPYSDVEDAIELSRKGKGSLVCSITTKDTNIAKEFTLGAATHHGRILILNSECAKESTGHGSPLPLLVHGGPGRAGGGEEMGGIRGVKHYLQRCAIQGSPSFISKVTNVYQQGAEGIEKDKHPFQMHFEELEIGHTYHTAKHTVTEADITNFANVSGDHFYAHMDGTSLEGTIFEQRVAHGYFILSKAAGLFVDAKKGPVLLNYGIDECRFTKPVYPGATIGVRFSVKEKIDQEKKDEEDIAKGIVKFLVDVYDETGETVALATILTMVKKINQEE